MPKDITINKSSLTTETDKGIVICSEQGNITIKASQTDFKGIIYAPNGTVTIQSNQINIIGKIIAKRIIISNSTVSIKPLEGAKDLVMPSY